jgi:hypothetical protein
LCSAINLPISRQIHIFDSKIILALGEFTSAVTVARPKSASLRTTVPEGIAKLIDLKAGDELMWTVTANKQGVVVTVGKKGK